RSASRTADRPVGRSLRLRSDPDRAASATTLAASRAAEPRILLRRPLSPTCRARWATARSATGSLQRPGVLTWLQPPQSEIGPVSHHSDLIDTTEMYLRTVYELEEEGVVPLRARIAERLGQSGPTVSQTVARMERDGLLHVADDRHLQLSARGRREAIAVMRKHRLSQRLPPARIGLGLGHHHVQPRPL